MSPVQASPSPSRRSHEPPSLKVYRAEGLPSTSAVAFLSLHCGRSPVTIAEPLLWPSPKLSRLPSVTEPVLAGKDLPGDVGKIAHGL
ncbi:uncharacterized protein [Arachis hypogaea]|uniref:uncharacterized protein isoform X3 n=1 Tax=Arachis hypogaea TaxID=3818 RepID=UPI000DEC36CB|nr:uncharacterized protein LOC112702949 isoform X4 [Arachis hypogaea]